MIRLALAVLTIASLFVYVAAGEVEASNSQATPSARAAANEMCPVTPDELAVPEFSAEYEGRTVYFCCARCRTRFQRDPERFRPALTSMGVLHDPDDAQPHGSDEHAHDEHELHRTDDGHDHDAPGSAVDHEPHDEDPHAHHDHHHGEVPPLLEWLGRFHPMSVHLPIDLLLGAAIAELLRLMTRRRWFSNAARFCIWVGAAGAVVAAPLGWFNAGWEITHDDWIMGTHRWLGTTVFMWSIMLVVLVELARRRPETRWPALYLAALFIGAILTCTTGHFGGMLVHGANYYRW